MKLIIAGIIFLLLCVIWLQYIDLNDALVSIKLQKQNINTREQIGNYWEQSYYECDKSNKKSHEQFLELFNICRESQQTCVKPETPL